MAQINSLIFADLSLLVMQNGKLNGRQAHANSLYCVTYYVHCGEKITTIGT